MVILSTLSLGVKMTMVVFFSLHLLITSCACLVIKKIDVRRVDYCKLPCRQGNAQGQVVATHVNSACNCRRNPDFVEETDDLIQFRTDMIKRHNYYRNRIAGGLQEQKDEKYYPKAANMRALSYSLEHEYIARCYAVKIYDYHDKCRRSTQWEHCGQNLGFALNPHTNTYEYFTAWWSEYELYDPDWVDAFHAQGSEQHAHFTQLSWALDFQVGCARSFCPTKNKSSYQWAFLCNYGGGFSNVPGRPLYIRGEPCSKCPSGTKCNKEYPNLCGEIDPIPLDALVPIFLEGEEVPEDWNATDMYATTEATNVTNATSSAYACYFNKISFVFGVVLYVV